MVWAIVVVAIAVLGAAAWAGTGRLGEMPEPVSDRPKALIPDGPVDQAFLDDVSFPRAVMGYHRSHVDSFLAGHVSGEVQDPDPAFEVVRGGYDMQAVDLVLDRVRVSDTPTALDDNSTHDAASLASPDPVVLQAPEPGMDASAAPEKDGETFDTLEPEGADDDAENDVVGSIKGELPAP